MNSIPVMRNVPLREPILDVFESVDPLLDLQRHDDAPFSQREYIRVLGGVEGHDGEVLRRNGPPSPARVPRITDAGQRGTQSIAPLIQYPVNPWPAS